MYIRLIGGTPQFCTLSDLHKAFPDVSFPQTPDATLLADYNVFPVEPLPRPDYDPLTQTLREGMPEYQDDRWVTSWILVARSTQAVAEDIRALRDAKLAASDWISVKHLEAGTAIPSAWADYRQALRDLPAQPGFPFSVTWPVQPE